MDSGDIPQGVLHDAPENPFSSTACWDFPHQQELWWFFPSCLHVDHLLVDLGIPKLINLQV